MILSSPISFSLTFSPEIELDGGNDEKPQGDRNRF